MRFPRALTPFSFLVLLPSLAWGLGFRLPDQDATATARGNAFTATADNPSAIYYNPAGIMQLDGLNSRSSLYDITIDDEYRPLHGDSGHYSKAHEPFQPVPQFFLTYHPTGKPFAFGLGVYSPFGLKTEWPDDASFRQAGEYGSIVDIDIAPTVAVQITRTLSFGAGLEINYIKGELRQGLTPMEGDSFSFKGHAVSLGGNFGLLWKPTERQSIGLSYHTPVYADLHGSTHEGLNGYERGEAEAGNAKIAAGEEKLATGIKYIESLPIPAAVKAALIAKANQQFQSQLAAFNVPPGGSFPTSFPNLGANGTFDLPQFAVLGYSFRPTPQWNLEVDIDWTDWDALNTLNVNRSDRSTIHVPFNWTHSLIYEVGATRTFGVYRVSAGYMYSENSVPSASFNPITPDSARNLFSIGVGRTFGRLNVDLAYQLGVGNTRTIVNDSVADGRYSFLSNAVSISVGYHF